MNLPTEIFGHVIVAHMPEEIGEEQAHLLANWLVSLERDRVIVDVDGAETIDSEGLEMLLDVQEKLRDEGGDLRIATTNHANRKIFEVTRIDQQIEVFDSVIEAVKTFA